MSSAPADLIAHCDEDDDVATAFCGDDDSDADTCTVREEDEQADFESGPRLHNSFLPPFFFEFEFPPQPFPLADADWADADGQLQAVWRPIHGQWPQPPAPQPQLIAPEPQRHGLARAESAADQLAADDEIHSADARLEP